MIITIDTSAIIAVITNESNKNKILKVTKGCTLVAPMSVHWEIGNAFSSMMKRNLINLKMAKQALKIYNEIPIKLIDILLDSSIKIAHKNKMYAYDAYLIQCLLQTNSNLLTLDKGLISVAVTMNLNILEI